MKTMESFERRLRRFLDNDPDEIPCTLLNSIDNYFLPQVKEAAKTKSEYLVLLGTHAIMQTVTKVIFGRTGPSATKFYLEQFVDGSETGRKYSSISQQIHDLRNVLAHQWLSGSGHEFVIDYNLSGGFQWCGTKLHFNPNNYLQDFCAGFVGTGGRIWDYEGLVSSSDLVLRKYQFIADWLDLKERDAVRAKIKRLKAVSTGVSRDRIEQEIRSEIERRYKL